MDPVEVASLQDVIEYHRIALEKSKKETLTISQKLESISIPRGDESPSVERIPNYSQVISFAWPFIEISHGNIIKSNIVKIITKLFV